MHAHILPYSIANTNTAHTRRKKWGARRLLLHHIPLLILPPLPFHTSSAGAGHGEAEHGKAAAGGEGTAVVAHGPGACMGQDPVPCDKQQRWPHATLPNSPLFNTWQYSPFLTLAGILTSMKTSAAPDSCMMGPQQNADWQMLVVNSGTSALVYYGWLNTNHCPLFPTTVG